MNIPSSETLHGHTLRAILKGTQSVLAAPTCEEQELRRAEERAGIQEVPLSDGPTLWPHTGWLLASALLGSLAAVLWPLVPNAWGHWAAFTALCGCGFAFLVSFDCLEEFHGHWRMEWFDPDLSGPGPDLSAPAGEEGHGR